MMIGLLGSLAEYERELIQERSVLKRAAARANGVKFGRPCKVSDADHIATAKTMKAPCETLSRVWGFPRPGVVLGLHGEPTLFARLHGVAGRAIWLPFRETHNKRFARDFGSSPSMPASGQLGASPRRRPYPSFSGPSQLVHSSYSPSR